MQASHKFFGVLIAILGVVLFSTKSVFIKLAYAYDIDTISLLALRMSFALPFYLVFFAVKWKEIKKLDKPLILQILGLGLVGYYLASWLDFKGLSFVSATVERLILFIYPTFVVLIARFLFNKKLTKAQIFALLLTYLGTAVIVLFNDNQTPDTYSVYYIGIGLILLSAVVYAFYLVLGGEVIVNVGTVNFTTIAMLSSTIGVLIHWLFASSDISLLSYPMPVYKYSFIMAVMATVIPSFLISEGIKRIGASSTAILGGIGPVSTLILAYLFLGESINTHQMGGTALVMAGVIIITISGKK